MGEIVVSSKPAILEYVCKGTIHWIVGNGVLERLKGLRATMKLLFSVLDRSILTYPEVRWDNAQPCQKSMGDKPAVLLQPWHYPSKCRCSHCQCHLPPLLEAAFGFVPKNGAPIHRFIKLAIPVVVITFSMLSPRCLNPILDIP